MRTNVLELTDIDLLDIEEFGRGVPHQWFAYLREHAPVFKHPEPYGPGFWVLTKHEDISAVGRDARTFSSDQALGGIDMLDDPPPDQAEVYPEAVAFDGNMLPLMDPPEHTLYRKIVHDAFRPRSIASLDEEIRSATIEILDTAVAQGNVEFAHDVAGKLTSRAIGELLGMPREDHHRIFHWSNEISEREDADFATRRDAASAAFVDALAYAQTLSVRLRREPDDGILSMVLASTIDGRSLSHADFTNFLVLLAVAGEETTRITLSHAILAFVENPDQYELLRHDPSLVDRAVDEIIRWATPALYFRRTVTRDTEIRGVEIKAGDKVSIWYISGNRDEDVFDDPFRFDITRYPNDHIAFGHGHHFCLGVHLARLEVKIFLQELIERVAAFELIGEVVHLRSNQIRAVKQLPVSLVANA